MPRTAIYTRNQIAKKTLHLIKERGPASFTARDVGAALGTSSRPIFTAFENMEDLRNELFTLGLKSFTRHMNWDLENPISYPEYCIRLVRWCQKEPMLSQFMLECIGNEFPHTVDPISANCKANLIKQGNLTERQFDILFKQTWGFALGIALQCGLARVEYADEQLRDMFIRCLVGVHSTFRYPDPKTALNDFGYDF